MKLSDWIEVESYFKTKANRPKVKIKKSSLTEADIIKYVETQKKLKKFFEEEFKPKDEKKKQTEMSVPQQMITYFFLGFVVVVLHYNTLAYLSRH